MPFDDFMREMLDPAKFLTHLPYALLVISMMMNDMGWLRTIAIVAGLVRILNRAYFEVDHVIVFWEVIFVAVNIGQLLILWYYKKRHRFSEEEKRFVENMPASVDRRTIRRLLKLSQRREAEPDTCLTRQGEEVGEVLFISEGLVQIERDDHIIGVCGPGDFVGEMSFISGRHANATARAARPVRYFAFDQHRLRAALTADAELQRAMEAGFNRNLIGKLEKANAGHA